jgi:hypothetical protein
MKSQKAVSSNNVLGNKQATIYKKFAIVSNVQAVNGENLSELDIQSSHAALESENAVSSTNLMVERAAPDNQIFAVLGDARKFNGKDDVSHYNDSQSLNNSRTKETVVPISRGRKGALSNES